VRQERLRAARNRRARGSVRAPLVAGGHDRGTRAIGSATVADDNGLGLFLTALPAQLAIDFATRADTAGFRSAWFPEITFGDSFVPATAAAIRTERIGIATGVVGVWSRSAVTMALQAATLQQLSNGRMVLGLGVQARGYVEGWHGQTYRKPVAAMRDYVTILRRIFSGEL